MKERRTHVRVAVDIPAAITAGQSKPVGGTIANVSERGIFLKAAVSPELHRPVHLTFILKPDHTLCEASGTVAWQAPHGIGVFFDEVNDPFLAFVQELAVAAKSVNESVKREIQQRILGDADIEIR